MLLLAMDRFKQEDNAAAIELLNKLSDNSLNKFAKPLILGWMNLADGKTRSGAARRWCRWPRTRA